jgi:hypothetical protein
MARQVRRDHPMCCYQVRNYSRPDSRKLTWAMQQKHRRSIPALEHGGGDASQLQPSICDRQFGQQLFTSVGARGAPTSFLHVALTIHRRLLPALLRTRLDHDTKQQSGLPHREKHASSPGRMQVIV